MTRRTTTFHVTKAEAEAKAAKLLRELRGYDPITRVWHDGTAWVVDMDLNDNCD